MRVTVAKKLTAEFVVMALLVVGAGMTGVSFAQEAELSHTPTEKRDVAGIDVGENVSIGVLLEFEAGYASQGSESASDFALATFEFGIEAEFHEMVKGRALMLWEEDGTEPIDLDEAAITLGGTEAVPVYLDAGKMYIPFGAFHSHFVSDPLVLELGEVRESAALLGYVNGIIDIRAGAFNGDLDDGDDHADNAIVAITVTPIDGIEMGAYWISDLGETEAMQEMIEDSAAEADATAATDTTAPGATAYNEVAAAGVYIHAAAGKLTLELEYMTALDDFDAGILGAAKVKPMSYNCEVAMAVAEDWELAVKVEGSDEFGDMPKTQYGIAASHGIFENASITVEYLRGEFNGDADDRDLVTAQLALEF